MLSTLGKESEQRGEQDMADNEAVCEQILSIARQSGYWDGEETKLNFEQLVALFKFDAGFAADHVNTVFRKLAVIDLKSFVRYVVSVSKGPLIDADASPNAIGVTTPIAGGSSGSGLIAGTDTNGEPATADKQPTQAEKALEVASGNHREEVDGLQKQIVAFQSEAAKGLPTLATTAAVEVVDSDATTCGGIVTSFFTDPL
jgi:hypothetical protein